MDSLHKLLVYLQLCGIVDGDNFCVLISLWNLVYFSQRECNLDSVLHRYKSDFYSVSKCGDQQVYNFISHSVNANATIFTTDFHFKLEYFLQYFKTNTCWILVYPSCRICILQYSSWYSTYFFQCNVIDISEFTFQLIFLLVNFRTLFLMVLSKTSVILLVDLRFFQKTPYSCLFVISFVNWCFKWDLTGRCNVEMCVMS